MLRAKKIAEDEQSVTVKATIDFVAILAQRYNISKSEVRRVMKQKGLTVVRGDLKIKVTDQDFEMQEQDILKFGQRKSLKIV